MGCFISIPRDAVAFRRRPRKLGDVAVYVPGLRIPKSIDFYQPLSGMISTGLIERLSALRARVTVMSAQEASIGARQRRKTATQQGVSTTDDLLQALEDYLSVLMGLAKDGFKLKYTVQFVWINQEDDAEETVMSNVVYEMLSILHLMALLCLSEANLLLLPSPSADVSQLRTPEESRRAAIDILLKAAGYLEFAIRHVLSQLTLEERMGLPIDLTEGKLQALCMQALGQGVDLQLGLAIDSPKATLAVKRRLACEMVKCWQQAQDHITELPLDDGRGQKHLLYIEWKCCEAKAAAYYYHGLILDEGNTEKSHGTAVASLQAAENFLKESKKTCEAFNATPPTSRNPPLWGSMKYLSSKIPKDVSSRVHANRVLDNHDTFFEVPARAVVQVWKSEFHTANLLQQLPKVPIHGRAIWIGSQPGSQGLCRPSSTPQFFAPVAGFAGRAQSEERFPRIQIPARTRLGRSRCVLLCERSPLRHGGKFINHHARRDHRMDFREDVLRVSGRRSDWPSATVGGGRVYRRMVSRGRSPANIF